MLPFDVDRANGRLSSTGKFRVEEGRDPSTRVLPLASEHEPRVLYAALRRGSLDGPRRPVEFHPAETPPASPGGQSDEQRGSHPSRNPRRTASPVLTTVIVATAMTTPRTVSANAVGWCWQAHRGLHSEARWRRIAGHSHTH